MKYEDIWQELRNSGLRITSLKKQIIRLFMEGGCGLSARDVLARICSSPHISTVHRCLFALEKSGFLRPERNSCGVLRYRCSTRFYPDHGHFSCSKCGRRIPLQVHLPDDFLRRMEQIGDFEIGSTDFFLEGICRQCSKGD